jgi:hypothetical protein
MEEFGRPVRVSVWCLGVPFQSKSQKAISYQLISEKESRLAMLKGDEVLF